MNKQNGSAHIIIIIGMVIALAAALGFIFWQNFIQEPEESSNSIQDSSEVTEASTELAQDGVITGSLTYPSEMIPSTLEVRATNIATGQEFATSEHITGSQYVYGTGYKLSVPAGEYYVYGVKDAGSDQRAYYDNFVECDFTDYDNCNDAGAKIVVTVNPGKDTKDIMMGDWYNPCLIPGGKQPTEKFDLPTC